MIGKESVGTVQPAATPSSVYRPAAWLPGPHAQTIAGRLLRLPTLVGQSMLERGLPWPRDTIRALPRFVRERIELPDGDFVDLDHAEYDTIPANAPVVLIMHGLEGSARRAYVVNTYRELAQRGIRAAGLNFRSCSGELNRTARFYHSGDTADIEYVLRLLADRYPHARRGAIGFSLGGNALLKLLGELGDAGRDLVDAAVAISVPYDLGAGADLLDTTRMGRFYANHFVKKLIVKAEAKAGLLDGLCDLDEVRRARSFRAFDGAVTAPLHGFANADDYYERSSSKRYLHGIRVPTWLIHSTDDPFLPETQFPHREIGQNTFLEAALTNAGGHVGFIEGAPWAPRFWAESQAATFLESVLTPQRTR